MSGVKRPRVTIISGESSSQDVEDRERDVDGSVDDGDESRYSVSPPPSHHHHHHHHREGADLDNSANSLAGFGLFEEDG